MHSNILGEELLLMMGPLTVLGFLAYCAILIWLDTTRRGFRPVHRLGYALLGALMPANFWWKARKIATLEESAPHDA